MSASIHVVAGVLRDERGRFLLAERGKCEEDEAPVDALARELREEIGIVVESARPLIAVPHMYPEKQILLDVWRVTAYSGAPVAHEGQRLAWVEADALEGIAMPPADRPVIAALPIYALGGLEPEDIDAAQMAGAQGIAAIRGMWLA
jgi:8-oxo-dGTP diphosphatase